MLSPMKIKVDAITATVANTRCLTRRCPEQLLMDHFVVFVARQRIKTNTWHPVRGSPIAKRAQEAKLCPSTIAQNVYALRVES